jgi:hypothetical protein
MALVRIMHERREAYVFGIPTSRAAIIFWRRSTRVGFHPLITAATYYPPHVYKDGTDDGQPVVTALFEEPTEDGAVGYPIREYSLAKDEMFHRFPSSGGQD